MPIYPLFLLTYQLKPNHTFLDGQLCVILSQSQVMDSNNQHGVDDNNYFIVKESKKARRSMDLPTKAVAIYIKKKQTIIGKTMSEVVNYCLLDQINKLRKLIQKYEYYKLIRLRILSRSGFENACL